MSAGDATGQTLATHRPTLIKEHSLAKLVRGRADPRCPMPRYCRRGLALKVAVFRFAAGHWQPHSGFSTLMARTGLRPLGPDRVRSATACAQGSRVCLSQKVSNRWPLRVIDAGMVRDTAGGSRAHLENLGRLPGCHSPARHARRLARRHPRAGPRRRRCQARHQVGEGDIRLRSMVDTLAVRPQHGWKQIVFGHIGRKPEQSLAAVGKRLGELLKANVPLVVDWFDESTSTIRDRVRDQIAAAPPGTVILLENTRQYDIERVLWKAKPDDLPRLAEPLGQAGQSIRRKDRHGLRQRGPFRGQSRCVEHDCAGSYAPVALGAYVADQFDGPMMRCLAAQLVVFSGIKIDKLDDLEAVIGRGSAQVIFTAGSLAMALKKAEAELAGKTCSLGVAEDPTHGDKPYFIPASGSNRPNGCSSKDAKRESSSCCRSTSCCKDGKASETIGPQDQQFDIGPKSCAVFAEAIGKFIAAPSKDPKVAFHNGVFGMFEDARFEEGTRKFIGELKRLKDGGVEVYIGGGEGGTALERYGAPRPRHPHLHRRRHRAQRTGERTGPLSGGAGHGCPEPGQALSGPSRAPAGSKKGRPIAKATVLRLPFATIARERGSQAYRA